MQITEIITVVGTALGAGGLGSVLTAWIGRVKSKDAGETEGWRAAVKAAQDATEAARAEAETMGNAIAQERAFYYQERQAARKAWEQVEAVQREHGDCLELVNRLREEHAPCPGKISALESQVSQLRASLPATNQ